ncbi:MAG: DUF1572 family protein [Planctomycetota bacterium]
MSDKEAANALQIAFAREANFCLDYGMNKIEHCLRQLDDAQVWWRPREEMNSIGNLLLHVAGNLRQWIVAGVGDVEDVRVRQAEFDERALPKAEVFDQLRNVIEQAKVTITSTSASELLTDKIIQGHDTNKMQAIWHSVTHFQGHVQEIIGMTRQQLGPAYEFEWSPSSPEEGA